MRVDLKVIPGARQCSIKKEGTNVKVYLTAPAVDGKANKQLIEVLAKHYQARKSSIKIIKGLKSMNKTVMINDY